MVGVRVISFFFFSKTLLKTRHSGQTIGAASDEDGAVRPLAVPISGAGKSLRLTSYSNVGPQQPVDSRLEILRRAYFAVIP